MDDFEGVGFSLCAGLWIFTSTPGIQGAICTIWRCKLHFVEVQFALRRGANCTSPRCKLHFHTRLMTLEAPSCKIINLANATPPSLVSASSNHEAVAIAALFLSQRHHTSQLCCNPISTPVHQRCITPAVILQADFLFLQACTRVLTCRRKPSWV